LTTAASKSAQGSRKINAYPLTQTHRNFSIHLQPFAPTLLKGVVNNPMAANDQIVVLAADKYESLAKSQFCEKPAKTPP
jgi:hypothetical protein